MLDHHADPFDGPLGGSDVDSTFVLSSADWFGAEDRWRGCGHHRVAEVIDGRLDLTGMDSGVGTRLVGLHRRIAAAVVEGLPWPLESTGLADCDDLIHEIESEWRLCGQGFPTDPDVEGWIDVLVDRTESRFVEWCFRLLRTIGRGTVERFEPIDPLDGGLEQVWSTAEPELLVRDLALALDGQAPVMVHDPLLSPRRIPA